MKIQVIGSGCTTCKNLYELTKKAVGELGLQDEVEYSTDITKLLELGVMTSPVMVIDDKPVLLGSTTSIDKVKALIQSGKANKDVQKATCACGSTC